MNKKIMSIIIMLVMLTNLVFGQSFQTPTISISILNQDPDPVNPGEYVELRFKIINERAGSSAKNLEIKLSPSYPFTLDPNEDEVKLIGDLPALGNGENALVVKYKLKVDESVVEGVNKINVEYKHDNSDWVSQEFDVNVQTRDANIAVVSVETVPEKIKPGEETIVKVKVKNMADSTMRDVALKLDLTYSSVLTTATLASFDSLPFAPLGSSTEQKISSLKPNEVHEFEYNLISYSDAESKVYKVPIVITYYDELETQYTKNDIMGLVVGTKPDLSVIVDETDLMVGKRTGTVSIRFINKGFSDVKFLDVTVPSNGKYELLSPEEVYVGNVDSDDYETAEFKVYLKEEKNEEHEIMLPVKVEYRDANNNIYTENIELMVNIHKSSKITGTNPMQSLIGTLFGFGFLVLIALAFFFIGRRAGRRKK
jgi:hypothetical protein